MHLITIYFFFFLIDKCAKNSNLSHKNVHCKWTKNEKTQQAKLKQKDTYRSVKIKDVCEDDDEDP